MNNWKWSVFLLLVSCASPNKEIFNKSNFEVVNFGMYTTQTDYKEDLDTSPTGKMARSGDRTHIKTTTEVPSKLDTRFGVEYIVHSAKTDRVRLKFKWIPSTPVKGKSGKMHNEISYEKLKKTNKLQYAGYILSIESELEPDSWTMQIFARDILLHEKTFDVY
ncbi:MAG: DUF3859 domain-containing protein [Gammaproteobacteria bacterium]|nr:DUF3859 domain-containing protein [Gammaproteobacteria bacterium]